LNIITNIVINKHKNEAEEHIGV